jgi:serine/threonine-protein kinase RsbW
MIRPVQGRADDLSDVSLELAAEAQSVSRARAAVVELAKRSGADADAVALAVSEAVGNSVIHGFRGKEPGQISVRATAEARALVVVVSDDGNGMLPDLESPGLGLGTSLISHMASEATFKSSGAGTTVTMVFSLASASRPTAGTGDG